MFHYLRLEGVSMRIVDEEWLAQENNREQLQEDNEAESVMTLFQKLGHFWTYEKWKVIIPIVLLIVANSFIYTYRDERKALTLDIALVNAVMETDEDITFDDCFAQECNIDVSDAPIKVETGMIHPKDLDSQVINDEVAVASIQKYSALLTSGKVDVTVSNAWAIDEYAQSNAYEDLRELLPADTYEEIEDKLYYHINEDGKKIPVGIVVDEIDSINQLYSEEPIVTISKYSKRKEQSIMFVKWLAKSIQ